MLTSDYLPNIGGIASHIYELSKALIANGHEVEVWVWDRKYDSPSIVEMGDVPVRILNKNILKGRFCTARGLAKSIKIFFPSFYPDIIHVHTLDSLMPAMKWVKKDFAGKVIWTNHSSRYLRKVDSALWRLKIKYYAQSFDGLLTACQERLEKSLFLGVPESCCMFVANGVDPDKYEQISQYDARESLNIPHERFILLYTGRFAPIKGVIYLAQAVPLLLKKIPELLCIMCGNIDGDRESEKVRSFIYENNLEEHIRMEGFIKNENLGQYLIACDSLVLPSLMEATSISALEAMSVGRPVVGSRVGGIPQLVIEGKTGVLVNPADPEDLARGIEKLWEMPDREKLGVNGRDMVLSGYTWGHMANKVLELYLKVIDFTKIKCI